MTDGRRDEEGERGEHRERSKRQSLLSLRCQRHISRLDGSLERAGTLPGFGSKPKYRYLQALCVQKSATTIYRLSQGTNKGSLPGFDADGTDSPALTADGYLPLS